MSPPRSARTGVSRNVGPNNPMWKDLPSGDPRGRGRAWYWYEVTICEDCGQPARDRHHIDGNPVNNDRGNIAILCRSCHMKRDGRLEAVRANPPRKPIRWTYCLNCGRDRDVRPNGKSNMSKGRCHNCDAYWRRHGIERPHTEAEA